MHTRRAIAAAVVAALTLTACGSEIPDEPLRTGEPPATPTTLPEADG